MVSIYSMLMSFHFPLQDQWLVDASVNLNPKLKLSPRNQVIALYAITRLDISNNSLTELPDMIFQLPSLKVRIMLANLPYIPLKN